MEETDMKETDMKESGMKESGMKEPDMEEAGMKETSMGEAGMKEPDMEEAGMKETSMKETGMEEAESRRTFKDLVEIVDILRSEGGCPWDRKQTHESLMTCIEEECGEVLAAIEKGDTENLCEELGDLMYLIVLSSRIAWENGEFALDDVTEGICAKMVRRHPNVFGKVIIHSAEEGMDLWNWIKKQEKGKKP